MEYKSWLEQEREALVSDNEKIAATKKQLLEGLQKWEKLEGSYLLEEELMEGFVHLRMEKELFDLGEKMIEKFTDPKDAWWVATTVYSQFAYFCLMERRLTQALHWYLRAIEIYFPAAKLYAKNIAACYAELGDLKQADTWIERCITADQKAGMDGWLEWVDFADYFQATGRPERALAICQSVMGHHQYCPQNIRMVMAKAYQDLGDYDKVIETYHDHLAIWPKDVDAVFCLGVAYYELKKDLEKAETHMLQAIDLVKDDKQYAQWIPSVYNSLAVIHFNCSAWRKGFDHLENYYKLAYPPEEAALFSKIIASLPEFESTDMGLAYVHTIFQFEKSPLRPTLSSESAGSASTNPTDEVKDATKGNFDWSNLTNLDDTQAN